MKKIMLFLVSVAMFAGFVPMVSAQTAMKTVDRADDHAALRLMLVEAEKAINGGKFDDLTQYLDPDINVIYQNAEVADGIPEVKKFQARIFDKTSGVLKSVKTKLTADKLSEFYGDTAISYGTAVDHYSFIGGLEMDVTSRWSTTLVKKNGVWKVVSLQFTSNLFDNPLLSSAKTSAKYFGIGGALAGILIGFIGCRFLRKKQ